jgi:hypothetical protein
MNSKLSSLTLLIYPLGSLKLLHIHVANKFLFFFLSIYFFLQVVGKEHNTLIFDVKGPNSHQSTKHYNALFVCIAGDSSHRAKFEFYVQHTFR